MKILILCISICGLVIGATLTPRDSDLSPSGQQERQTQQRFQQRQGKQQKQQQQDTLERDISLKARGRTLVEFDVAVKGKIAISFQGDRSSRVSLAIRGPGRRTPYALKAGSGTVKVEHEASKSEVAAGTKWSVSIVNLSSRRSASGKVHVSFPKAVTEEMVQPDQPDVITPDQPQPFPGGKPGEKYVRYKNYEIVETQGYTEAEVQQIRTALQARKRTDAKARWQTEIQTLAQRNKAAGIVVPLLMQRIQRTTTASAKRRQVPRKSLRPGQRVREPSEKKGKFRQRIKSTQPGQPQQLPPSATAQQMPMYEIDVHEHMATMVQAYQDIAPAFRSRHLHPRYANLRVNQEVDKKQLGEDLVNAVYPNFQRDLRTTLRNAFAADKPRIKWDAATAKRLSQKTKQRTARQRATRQRTTKQATATPQGVQLDASETGKLQTLIRAANRNPSANRGRLAEFLLDHQALKPQHLEAVEPSVIQQALLDTIQPYVPDLNGKHTVVDYYNYMIELDWFHCLQRDEWTPDEPYFHIRSRVPLFDPNDPEHIDSLEMGQVYQFNSQVTSSHSGVTDGTTRRVRDGRLVINDTTYNTEMPFTITLFEEDFSKQYTTEAIRQRMAEIESEFADFIRDAVVSHVQDRLIYELISLPQGLFPELPAVGLSQLQALLNNVVDGLPLGDFLMSLDALFDGDVDPTWVIVHLVLSGGDLNEVLASVGSGDPTVGAIILAIKFAGPAVYEFFGELFVGNVGQAFGAIIELPFRIVESVVHSIVSVMEAVVYIVDTVEMIMATIDPDDVIGSQTVRIEASQTDMFADAAWCQPTPNSFHSVPVNQANSQFQQLGFGPTAVNNNLIRNGRYHQPMLRFSRPQHQGGSSGFGPWDPGTSQVPKSGPKSSSDAIYRAYYNVRRWNSGAVESFGFTARNDHFPLEPRATYRARTSGKIKVSVYSLNTALPPTVRVTTPANTTVIGGGEVTEFEIDAVEDQIYSLYIDNFYPTTAVYGFVTFSEMPVVPPPVIRGQVKHKTTFAPVRNARINIAGQQTFTDTNGNYRFEFSDPGVYTVRASAAQYDPQSKTISIHRGTKQLSFYLESPFDDPDSSDGYVPKK